MRTVLLIAAAPFVAEPASSQGTNASACAPIQDDSVRLACYDSVLRPAPTAQDAAPPQSTAAPQSVAPAAAAVPLGQAIAEPPQREVRGASRNATAPSAPAAAAITPAAAADPTLGAIVIVGMREAQGHALVFTTDTGGVWVQTDTQRSRNMPDVPFSAELKEGSLNSRFLVPTGGRAIRVRAAE